MYVFNTMNDTVDITANGGFKPGILMFKARGEGYSDLVPTGVCRWTAKPVPIFKGHFGGKGYPLLGVFIQENYVFVYFSDEMGENI